MNKNQQSLSPRDMHMGVTEGEDMEGSWGRKEGTVTKTWLRNSQRREETDHSTKNLNKLKRMNTDTTHWGEPEILKRAPW